MHTINKHLFITRLSLTFFPPISFLVATEIVMDTETEVSMESGRG